MGTICLTKKCDILSLSVIKGVVLNLIIKDIKREAETLGIDLIVKRTQSKLETYVLANKNINKAILIGQNKNDDIKCYQIDMKKWFWAESEGFTTDEIIEDLFDEIFIQCDISSPHSSVPEFLILLKLLKRNIFLI